MNPVLFVTDYIKWHYSIAFADIMRVWSNFLWFTLHFPSTASLLKTFFSPWKRMHEEKPPRGTFDPSYYMGSIVINTIMRFVGMLVRSVIITISLSLFSFVFMVGAVFLIFWCVSPVLVFFILISGFNTLALR